MIYSAWPHLAQRAKIDSFSNLDLDFLNLSLGLRFRIEWGFQNAVYCFVKCCHLSPVFLKLIIYKFWGWD